MMAKFGDIKITVDFDPIVKLKCINSDCIHHLFELGYARCNLKYININDEGECEQCQKKSILKKMTEE
jgi:hypothetical protein